MRTLGWLFLAAFLVAPSILSILKRYWLLAGVGLGASFVLFFILILPSSLGLAGPIMLSTAMAAGLAALAPIAGALGPATEGSWWARTFYDDGKTKQARMRDTHRSEQGRGDGLQDHRLRTARSLQQHRWKG